MNKDLDFKTKELEKMKHLESFVTKDKTIVEYKPHIWSDKQFITFRFKKDKKKGNHYTPVFKSKSLDSALFVYNNLHIYDMNMKRQKELIRLDSHKNDNLTKVFLLDADHPELGNKRLEIAKGKELNVRIINIADPDELCLE